MVTVTFEITENRTEVAVIGSTGIVEKMDVTNTEIEKSLIGMLKQIQNKKLTKQITDALDINSWESIS